MRRRLSRGEEKSAGVCRRVEMRASHVSAKFAVTNGRGEDFTGSALFLFRDLERDFLFGDGVLEGRDFGFDLAQAGVFSRAIEEV